MDLDRRTKSVRNTGRDSAALQAYAKALGQCTDDILNTVGNLKPVI